MKLYVPSKVLREFLSYRIKQIIEDDAAIRRDGMDILSDLCIRQVNLILNLIHRCNKQSWIFLNNEEIVITLMKCQESITIIQSKVFICFFHN